MGQGADQLGALGAGVEGVRREESSGFLLGSLSNFFP